MAQVAGGESGETNVGQGIQGSVYVSEFPFVHLPPSQLFYTGEELIWESLVYYK